MSELHDKDLAADYDGVFLVDALDKKYPNAAKDFIWQWFFPQKELTLVLSGNERRRYHLHESQLQEALKKAVRQAKLTKRVKSQIPEVRFHMNTCVEGRNGHLSLRHHGLHRLSNRKLFALTSVHNYFIRRKDGATPAGRFFKNKPKDIFEFLPSKIDLPGRPARSRS